MDAGRSSQASPMKNRMSVERRSERELVVTRTINAPPRIVFEAWTKAELFQRWWVPKSFGLSCFPASSTFAWAARTASCSATLPPRSPWRSTAGTSK